MQDTLSNYPNLTLKAGSVAELLLDRSSSSRHGPQEAASIHGKVTGIRTEAGETIPCDKVIISTGTFLGGQINIGLKSTPFGRIE
jgi:tRNA uridine 5-carboxymethylaminomethyl modification enzyme